MASKKNYKWLTTVTPLSKTIALVLFIVFPFIGFYLGIQYQKLQKVILYGKPVLQSSSIPEALNVPKLPSEFKWEKTQQVEYLHYQDNGTGGVYELKGNSWKTSIKDSEDNREIIQNYYKEKLENSVWKDASDQVFNIQGLDLGVSTFIGGGPCKTPEFMMIGNNGDMLRVISVKYMLDPCGGDGAGMVRSSKPTNLDLTVFISDPTPISSIQQEAELNR